MAPRKVRLVGALLQGLSVNEAEAQLLHMRRRSAKPLLKLLRSAMTNVKNNQKISTDKMYIESVRVDQGPMLKRYLPRARGSASPLQKKMSHVTMILNENLALAAQRFTIQRPKKAKLPPADRPKAKKAKEPRGGEETQAKKQSQGFFKKMFSRKTGVGK